MQDLNIAILQNEIKWEDPIENYKLFTKQIGSITDKVDLIILPETFSTGFTSNVESASQSSAETINWMKNNAEKYDCAIIGSIIHKSKNKYKNRLFFVTPNQVFTYDKRHLFTLPSIQSSHPESKLVTSGNSRKIIEFRGWKILPTICFDLRFPKWNYNDKGYDILLNIANWPSTRSKDWSILLKARAIENQAYVLACNRIGYVSELELSYSGNSMCLDYQGNILGSLQENHSGIIIQNLNKDTMMQFREKFPVIKR